MSKRVSVSPDVNRGAGHALIRVEGLKPGAAPLRFRLHRTDYGADWLGPAGWQVSEALLEPGSVLADDTGVTLRVGPDVCNEVPEGSFEFSIPSAGIAEMVFWPEIRPQHAGIRRGSRAGRASAGTAPPAPAPVRPEPVPAPEPAPLPPQPVPAFDELDTTLDLKRDDLPPPWPEPEKPVQQGPGRSRLWLLLGALLLAAGALGLWYGTRPDPEPASPPPPAAPPPQAAVDLTRMRVPEIVARGNPAEMLSEGNRRLSSGQQDDGLALILSAADLHHGPALAAAARFYDPLQPRVPGTSANPRQAARYYQEAARESQPEPGVVEQRRALQQWLQVRASGNPRGEETLILKDFW
jgi:hypothetical protein